ncbi:MAG TPA: choice-of-anchor L domain-containing protein [Chitinophagaceae bacterium]|nr:choice-of-anchor L domain-containing protein [Chitinophagaceae bacterium]
MKKRLHPFFLLLLTCLTSYITEAQLIITQHPDATALAQKLVGDGVSISNVSFTGNSLMASFFLNRANRTNIGIDSGIVLTSGRAKTAGNNFGVDGNGITPASAVEADNGWGLPGDPDLALAIGALTMRDACVLEFDFVPLGDSVKFNYVFSSEEYTPNYVCTFNDAFAFFISGPGITGLKNIALIPNTVTPVSIFNVNNVPGGACPNNIAYYIDNLTNTFFTHEGHTTVLTAKEQVQPCQTYHLKIVIADIGDAAVDSGVFLQAKSLTSNAFGITNLTQTDPTSGNSYLVEGCAVGAFNITRPRRDPNPLNIMLSYGGSALNTIDVQTLPAFVTIPANDSFVTVNVFPLIDGAPEGIEELKIFALAGCAAGIPTDSTMIQIRDYDILSLAPDTAIICKGSSIQLTASAGYDVYQWLPDPTLSNTTIRDPVATPVNSETTYICTANVGTCNARDSVFLKWKDGALLSKLDVNCRNAATGNIRVTAGPEWIQPVQFSLDGVNWQSDSSFFNLPAGNYAVKIRDANCIDSVMVTINQAFPDLLIDNAAITAASCSGNADGQLSITASGGNAPYSYSQDGVNFQPGNTFNLIAGNYTVTIKDNNGCLASQNGVIPLNNTVTIDAGTDAAICEGTSHLMTAVSNATSFAWTPAATLQNATSLTPVASPAATTVYYVTATTGICTRTDSVTINVWPAPVPNAGADIAVCFGKVFNLDGSGGVSYQWSPSTYMTTAANIPSPSVKATNNITYSLMVTDARGCTSLTPDDVKVTVTPAVRIFAGKDTVAAINQPVQLQAIELGNAGVTQYTWSPANFLNDPTVANPIATLPNDFRYTVTGTTPEGCEGMDEILIKAYKGPEIYVPSGFTPDDNGLNDVLKPIPVGIREFRYFRVFNRWGQIVFSTQDPNKGWDGRINGIRQPTGTFVWMAEAIDYKGNLISRRGFVTIVR